MKYLLTLSLALCMLAFAQQPEATQQPAAESGCDAMMAKMQQHRAEMRQMDERLQIGLQRMNQASGDAKVDAMAEVVTMLAQQRIQMHERMMSMGEERSQHMMGHMQQGDKGMQAMMDCPMMQQQTTGRR